MPRLRQALPVVLAVVLLFAAGAYGLSSVLSSSGSPAAATVSPPNGPIRWLGMQIASVTPGTAVIETVAPGSSGERAGLEPGDILVAVNGRPITAPEQIAGAVSALRPGAYVEVQVNRGSTPFIAQAVLVGPPSNHP
ncbi:MAG: PDZ domain-containing protein [Solirubrobacterales bacterium]|nr:PDZ domain-containing protein [Solirubrobacterales bacterium]MBV9714776.1 PDZ domain-containing protein [Solirubrobacterales bacterium]